MNRYILEGLAHIGKGEPFVITEQSEAAGQAERVREMVNHSVLTDIKVRFDGFDAYDMEPSNIPTCLPTALSSSPENPGESLKEASVSTVIQAKACSLKLLMASVKASDENDALKYLGPGNNEILDDYCRFP